MMGLRKARELAFRIPASVFLLLLFSQVNSLDWLEHHRPVHETSYLYNVDELNTSSEHFREELEDLSEFHGNSSHTDHFKLLKEDGTSVLVGARNVIYNLSLPNLIEYTEEVICQSKLKSGRAYSICGNTLMVTFFTP